MQCVAAGRKREQVVLPDRLQEAEAQQDLVVGLGAADVPAAEGPPSNEVRKKEPDASMVAVPEHSLPKEASNGNAESAVRTLVDQARTLDAALEAKLGRTKPLRCSHPVVSCMRMHAAWALNKYNMDSQGRHPIGCCSIGAKRAE